MKRLLTLTLALVMSLSLTACGGSDDAGSSDESDVSVSASQSAEDGSGDLILRLYEAKKAAINTKVFTALNVAQAWTCDMLEKKEAEVAVEDNTVSLDFRAFEIKTLRLKLA